MSRRLKGAEGLQPGISFTNDFVTAMASRLLDVVFQPRHYNTYLTARIRQAIFGARGLITAVIPIEGALNAGESVTSPRTLKAVPETSMSYMRTVILKMPCSGPLDQHAFS